MITTALITLLYWLIWLFITPLRAFSDVVLNTDISEAIATASTYLGGLSAVVPIGTILAVFGIFLTVEVAILVWKGINWLIRKIPTIN
jgi:polyferredoxin